jgi:hypothetical protein
MKNITVSIADPQYRAAIERTRRNQNTTHRFRGVNKCEPPQSSQSQQVNQPVATSHRIAANVQL